VAVLAVVAAALVVRSLNRPEVPTFSPTLVGVEAGTNLVGPLTYTLDASSPDRWLFFSFSSGSFLESPGPMSWDLAFRRFTIISNGGPGFGGSAGVLSLGPVDFEQVRTVPRDGYVTTTVRRDSVNAAVQRWYECGFTSHLLTPKPLVYAVRTAAGKYAKLEFLSYYCPGALPGCVTFRYVYQGSGEPDFEGRGPTGVESPPPDPREPPH
jgi:hypothetical protein